ncbi:MAG: hypothetical protein KAU29_06915 [Gammaproteobacteria bacterium]|nr:hypothetical protein [Gammaproteobacteria bacterium]
MFEVRRPQWLQLHCLIALAASALSTLFYHHSALADTRYSSFNNNFSNQAPIDFSLSFSRSDLDLTSNKISYPIRQSRISANVFNRVSTNLNIGLIIGSNYLSLSNDTATAGLSLNGNHIGFAINGIFGEDIQLALRARYIYQEATGENTLRIASLTWHEWLAEVTLRFSMGSQWALITGAGVMGLDVDRRVSGDINETIRMKLADNVQGKLAIELLTAPADRIRLTLKKGAANGLQLSFAHAF